MPARYRPLLVVLVLLGAGCGKAHRESGTEILQRAEMRDAWLATAVPFAVAFLLVIALVIMRRRRKPDTTLPGLFRRYQPSDIRRWWQERVAAFDEYRANRRERAAAEAIEISKAQAAYIAMKSAPPISVAERVPVRGERFAMTGIGASEPVGPSDLGPRSARAWIIGLTVTAIAIILMIPPMGMATLSPDLPRAPFMLLALPHLIVFVLFVSSHDPGGGAWGWVRGIAVASALILVSAGAIAALSVVWFFLYGIIPPAILLLELATRLETIRFRIGTPGVMLLIVLLGTQVVAGWIAKQRKAALPQDDSDSYQLQTILSFIAFAVFALVAVNVGANLVEPLDAHGVTKEKRGRDVVAASAAIVDVQRCAHTVAASNPTHGYPASLAAMGPRGAGCLDSATASGARAGSIVRYFVQSRDSAGGVAHFWVMSRDDAGRAGTHYYVGDDLGNLFAGKYDPKSDRGNHVDSTAYFEPIHSPAQRLVDLSLCIHSDYGSYLHEFPLDLSLDSKHHHPPGRCIASPDRNSAVVTLDSGAAAGPVNFVLTYHPGPVDRDHPSPTTFWLTARPVSYGEGTIRSFMLWNDTIHVTSEWRGAALSDPLVQHCELNFTYPCTLAGAPARPRY